MIKRTHLAIGLAVSLYFLPHVADNIKLLFIPTVLVASLLPDLDNPRSFLGQKKMFRPIQAVVSHRGLLHSYTACILFTLLLMFYQPLYSIGFFLGYSFHLFADSFTIDGIRPFWPWKLESKGMIRTGSKLDDMIFIFFLALSVIFFVFLFL